MSDLPVIHRLFVDDTKEPLSPNYIIVRNGAMAVRLARKFKIKEMVLDFYLDLHPKSTGLDVLNEMLNLGILVSDLPDIIIFNSTDPRRNLEMMEFAIEEGPYVQDHDHENDYSGFTVKRRDPEVL